MVVVTANMTACHLHGWCKATTCVPIHNVKDDSRSHEFVKLTEYITNDYVRRARLYPAMIVVLPLALAAICIFPSISSLSILLTCVGYCGLSLLIAELGRDGGKALEPSLFENWGGKPTTQLLRHSDTRLDPQTTARYHANLTALIPRLALPSAVQESNNPTGADDVYESCTKFLRERTRDKTQFPLVYSENVSYGFRRNLLGMKGAGIAVSIVSLLMTITTAILRFEPDAIPDVPAVATIIIAFIAVWWILRITPMWVSTPAFAYAEQLLAATDTLAPQANRTSNLFIPES